MPVQQWKWWIVLCLLALHGIIAVIVTELMTRSYGKWYIWLPVAMGIPLFGPLLIYIWHVGMATSIAETRKKTFWERMFYDSPININRILLREKERTEQVRLYTNGPNARRSATVKDMELEKLLEQEKFPEARAQAWRMMEIAKDMRDTGKMNQYRDYLELIAEKESLASGFEM
jgi:hypothetical protein